MWYADYYDMYGFCRKLPGLAGGHSQKYTIAQKVVSAHTQTIIVCQCSSWIDNDNNHADSLIEVYSFIFWYAWMNE